MVSLFNLGPNDNRSNSDIEAATFSQLGRRTRQPTTGAYNIRQYCFTSGVSPALPRLPVPRLRCFCLVPDRADRHFCLRFAMAYEPGRADRLVASFFVMALCARSNRSASCLFIACFFPPGRSPFFLRFRPLRLLDEPANHPRSVAASPRLQFWRPLIT